jgi:hypothetical protein
MFEGEVGRISTAFDQQSVRYQTDQQSSNSFAVLKVKLRMFSYCSLSEDPDDLHVVEY